MQSRYKSTRSVIALLLVAVMIIGFSATLYKIQVQDHEYYAAQNNTVKTYKVAIEAARGEIVDRNGNALVTNRETNSIILDAAYFRYGERQAQRHFAKSHCAVSEKRRGIHPKPALKAEKRQNRLFR